MLDSIALSEEELGMLFGPSHGSLEHRQPRSTGVRIQTLKKRKPKTTTTKTKTNPLVPARCGYRTGKCQNLQAFKRNGKLHKLCEFHRERANLNQKKLDRKKRMQRSKMPATSTSSSSSSESVTSENNTQSPRTVTSSFFIKAERELLDTRLVLPTNLHEAPLALGCEELAIFCSLMTFDIHHRAPPPSSCHYHANII